MCLSSWYNGPLANSVSADSAAASGVEGVKGLEPPFLKFLIKTNNFQWLLRERLNKYYVA